MKILRLMLLLMLPFKLIAQQATLKGFVHSTAARPVQGASVIVKKNDTSAIFSFAISHADGSFSVKAMDGEKKFLLQVRHISYEPQQMNIESAEKCCGDSILIILAERTPELKEVVIKREVPVTTRSDTIVFNANSYRTAEVRKLEDLLKNMQGFTVDANGRLSFNGKEVERVLIEGDDLADQGYQMITKNLDASLIDKVEVVDNFNTNRLMRSVERTNKVGINLRIASKYRARLSGSGEMGASANDRYVADVNSIFIGKNFKWLGFGSFNNVARDPSGNVRYYYQQEGGQFNEDEQNLLTQSVLESGSLTIPRVGDRYVKNNSDLGLALMNTWKIGKFTKVNTLSGFNDLSLQNQSESLVNTEISDLEKWTLNNVMDSRKRSRDLLLRGSLQTDRGKNHVRRINFGFQWSRELHRFSDLLSGAANDSLREQLKNKVSAIRVSWQETFLLKRQVFRVVLDYANGSVSQFLDNRSARYLSFWGLDSSYLRNQHQLDQRRQTLDLHLKMNGKKRVFQYEYGTSIQHREMTFFSQPKIISELQKPDVSPQPVYGDFGIFQVKGMFKGGIRTGNKGQLGINGELGFENLKNDSSSVGFEIFNGSVTYMHRFNLLRSLRLGYSVFNGFSDYDKLYPARLLSGNGIILSGLAFDKPVFSQAWSASFQANNFYKQRNWSLSANYKLLPRAYAMAIMILPELSEFGFSLTRDNRLFNGLFSWESFVKSVKGRMGIKLNYHMSEFNSILNGLEGRSDKTALDAETWWTSGFNFPLNMELKGGVAYTTGQWNGGAVNTNWQYHWNTKLKFKSAKKMYLAMSWNGFILSERNRFFGLDLFWSYPISKAVSIQLTGVNLLNSGRVTEKFVSPYNTSQSMFYVVERYVLVSGNISF